MIIFLKHLSMWNLESTDLCGVQKPADLPGVLGAVFVTFEETLCWSEVCE